MVDQLIDELLRGSLLHAISYPQLNPFLPDMIQCGPEVYVQMCINQII